MDAWKVLMLLVALLQFANCRYVDTPFNRTLMCNGSSGLLDMTTSNLQRIDKSFKKGLSYNCIDLSNNNITEIERGSLEHMKSLRYLNLTANKLPVNFLGYEHENLEVLVLDEALTDLRIPTSNERIYYPSFSMTLPNLKRLYMRRNNFQRIIVPSWHFSFPNIRQLDLSHNNLSSTVFLLTMPEELTHLYLHDNRLSEFRAQSTANLQWLILDNNNLSVLCGEQPCLNGIFLKSSTKLERLSLADNALTTIEKDALKDLIGLKDFDLARNYLSTIPHDAFDRVRELITLNMNGNRLKSLPNLCNSKKLETLMLAANELASINRGMFCDFQNLKRLNLRNNGIELMPPGVFDGLPMLKALDLSGNYLTTLPENWFAPAQARQLRSIDLGGNPLREIPPGCLDNLPKTVKIILQLRGGQAKCA